VNGILGVLYRELKIYRRRWRKHLAAYTISPLLFLVVFGWGVGRNIEMEGVTYLAFMLPGLATMAAMNQSYGTASEINIARFYWRIFEEFQMAPVHAWQIALGEVLYGMLRGLGAAAMVVVLAHLFGVAFPVNGATLGLFALHTFAFASAAVVAAMLVRSHADQGHINTFFIVPMSFLCGTFFPLSRLPGWAETVAYCLPLTHSSLTIRAATLGQTLPWLHVLAMLAFAALFFSAAVWSVRRATA